jgi:hypothetical protein
LHYKTIDGQGLETLKKMLVQDAPHSEDPQINVEKNSDHINMLVVADSGTYGLSGGVDPQMAAEDSNFCNFFYFSGQLETRQTGGGSYGIGRNVLFWASKIKTVLVYSQTIFEGKAQKRFMAMAAGKSFQHAGLNYTGRHWWGASDPERPGGVLPIVGDEAEALARAFGLLGHLNGATGTAIGVLEPDFEDVEQEMQSLKDALLVNAWPHLISNRGIEATLIPSISVNGVSIPVPDPSSEISPVKNFVEAYLQIETESRINIQSIYFEGQNETLEPYILSNNSKELGVLSWVKKIEATDNGIDLGSMGLPKGSSIALMRSSKIVVKYLQVPNPEDSSVVFGTFVADSNYEKAFRKSETATHDEWQAKRLNLGKGQRNPILQTLDKIQRVFIQHRTSKSEIGHEADIPIAIANRLGKLISGIGVTGGNLPNPSGKSNQATKQSGRSLKYKSDPILLRVEKNICFGEYSFKVQGEVSAAQPRWLRPQVRIWLGDAFEKESPAGVNRPEVLSVQLATEKGFVSLEEKHLDIKALTEGQEVKVSISYPDDVQIVCDFVSDEIGPNS